MTRLPQVLSAVGISALLWGCGAAAPSQSGLVSSPAIAPSVSAVASSTEYVRPTFTADDLKVQALIKDGYAQWLSYATGLASDADIPEMIAVVKDMHTFVRSQVALGAIYTPSDCTRSAMRLYRTAMDDALSAVESMLTWVQDGMVGDIPAAADLAPAADGLSAANTSLQATLC